MLCKKEASENEYEFHEMFYKAGIKTSKIIKWENGLLVTEFIEGKTLAKYKKSSNRKKLCKKLLIEIEKIHKLGYLHGDINESNIIISDTNEIYIIDFEFTDIIGCCCVGIDEEMMDMMRMFVILLSTDLYSVKKLLGLCERTDSSRLPFALKKGVDYDTIRKVLK